MHGVQPSAQGKNEGVQRDEDVHARGLRADGLGSWRHRGGRPHSAIRREQSLGSEILRAQTSGLMEPPRGTSGLREGHPSCTVEVPCMCVECVPAHRQQTLHRPQHAPQRRIARPAFVHPRPERPPSLQPLRRPSTSSRTTTPVPVLGVLALLALLAVLKWLPPRRTAPPACELCECVGEYDGGPSLWLGDSGRLPLAWVLGVW
ncbi:hypothetical protein C8R44DRAFT_896410 [Mycena epipterygia]|nr:hypothetical protein C8R44DRAFT_896410 [Mycena epipterygia]